MRRFTGLTRKIIIGFLQEMDGNICQLCNLKFDALTEQERERDPKRRITIHHVNNNKNDHRYDNLELLCNSCNSKKRHSINNRSLKEPHMGSNQTVCVKNNIVLPTEGDSYSAKKNDLCEKPSQKWLVKMVYDAKDIPITVKNAMNGVSNFIGCSPVTARRYIDKMSNPINGIFQDFSVGDVRNDRGDPILIFTDITDYQSTPQKLFKKYGIE